MLGIQNMPKKNGVWLQRKTSQQADQNPKPKRFRCRQVTSALEWKAKRDSELEDGKERKQRA